MSFVKEFREFALKGNVIDLAVGVIIGGAFGKIVDSMVSDLILPLVSILTGKVDFVNLYIPLAGQDSTTPLDVAKKAGAVLAYGNFLNTLIQFVILAFVIFFLVKTVNRLRREPEPSLEVPAGPTASETLLTEIRDLLKK
ncbi:MAG: large conductance mechanosensitive channel protein MscL [Fimbriimonas sp.]